MGNDGHLRSVALHLEGAQYLAGWKPEAGTLFLPTLSDGRVGQQVAVRVGIFGQSIRATLFGVISLVRRVGRPALPPGVELTLDRMSIPAAHFLALAARGEQVTYRERAPRYMVERNFTATRDGHEHSTRTLNISEGGCAISWPGPLPMVGEVIALRLGDGFFASSSRAVVCWNSVGGPVDRCVGLRIVAEGRTARSWKSVVSGAARSAVRAA